MQNHRISTTISQKHWELLKKHAEKFETQQKALESALECLENCSKQSPALIEEERIWMTIKSSNSLVVFQKTAFKLLLETADIEQMSTYFNQYKPTESAIEFYYQKPLNECSLKEVIDGLVICCKATNWFDTVDYTDDGAYYTLIFTHSLGSNLSKLNKTAFESVFKTYGVKFESTISPRTIFMKIFKS